MQPKMQKWTVWSLDVWGNAEDGYDVNDRCKVGTVEIPKQEEVDGTKTGDDVLNAIMAHDRAVIKALRDAGYLKAGLKTAHFDIDGDEGMLHIDWKKDGCPLYQLELQSEE